MVALMHVLHLPWYVFALAAGALMWAALFVTAIMLWRRHRRRLGR